MIKIFPSFIVFILISFSVKSQSVLTGTVLTEEKIPLIGATIRIHNSTDGSVSDVKGNFHFTTFKPSGHISIDYLGYISKTVAFNQSTDFVVVILESDYESIDEIIINGTTDLSTDRSTAIAATTIYTKSILQEIPNKEIPEILNATPSVYATKSGGGFGDSRINIRGFDQNNTAILLNGIPMNDMENSGFYWSNLLGLENVTTAIQVQRGLGASKLAISSVGGTINFITNSSQKNEGGTFSSSVGNNSHINTQLAYNSGVLNNGFSTSIALGYQSGDGYISGTAFNSLNYFLNFGWKKEAHDIQFTLLGSPQNHGQRINSYFNMATIKQHLQYGYKYNYNHGFLNGKDYNWTENYYHKPVASISWDWLISGNSKLSTTAYTTFGRGGGTSDLGRISNTFASSPIFRNETGLVRFDDIVSYNQGDEIIFSDGNSYQREPSSDGNYINSFRNRGLTRRAFTNSHFWAGMIANYHFKLSDVLRANVGTDLRYSQGSNYTRISNLLGADSYFDFFDRNNPNNVVSESYQTDLQSVINVFRDTDKDEKIFFHADGLVKWSGLFGNMTFSKNSITGFFQSAVSNQSFKRKDYFNYLDTDPDQSTKWVDILGGNCKIGLNYNLDNKHNIYLNSGFYSKQPRFDVVFLENDNTINKDYKNEKVVGIEFGYGFTTNKFKVKSTLYHTSWSNKFLKLNYINNTTQGTAKVLDLKQIHKGFEFESIYRPNHKLKITGMLSIGNWEYANNVTAKAFDSEQNYIGDAELNLKGVKVQDAAQLTAHIGVSYELIKNFQLVINQSFADKLYAAIAPEDNWANYDVSLELPAYSLTDTRILYKVTLADSFIESLHLGISIDNLLNTTYISESSTNYQSSSVSSENWNGINDRNKVFFGFGRTWNMSVRLTF